MNKSNYCSVLEKIHSDSFYQSGVSKCLVYSLGIENALDLCAKNGWPRSLSEFINNEGSPCTF